MYVNNLRLFVKHLRRDLVNGRDGLPDAAHSRLLLLGANGSGKSTILRAIADLWDFFGDWIDAGPGRNISGRSRCFKHYFAEADLAAMEIGGLLPGGVPLWIGMGKVQYWVDLKDDHPNAEFAGLVQSKGSWEVQLPHGIDWTTFRQRSLVGSELQPNVVYFPPELRTLALIRGKPVHIVDLTPYRWLASFNANVDLESLLLTIRARSPAGYDDALRSINQTFGNQRKRIAGFSPSGLVVQGTTEFRQEYEHDINQLSSGEKQMLLLIGFVAATLQRGGIVVIDEPDLHIHVAMITQLMEALEQVSRDRTSQLIVASHSQLVGDWFPREEERISLVAASEESFR